MECGLACFAMIADFYSVKVSLNDLRNLYPAPREGFSFLNLQEIAENYSFNVDAYEVSIEELKHIALPCIIQWGNNHFVVLEEINKNYNIIVDPNRGKIKIKQEDFEKNILVLL
ncbi:cysteine peptidase family C39 domain-containing protein [Bacillus toyonensis]